MDGRKSSGAGNRARRKTVEADLQVGLNTGLYESTVGYSVAVTRSLTAMPGTFRNMSARSCRMNENR